MHDPDGLGIISMICYKHHFHGDIIYSKYPNSTASWHRIGGPALIEETGEISWYVEDMCYQSTRMYCYACGYDDETLVLWLLKYGEDLPTHLDDI